MSSLQKQVVRERERVQRLESQLENPQNCQRWRKLEGDDGGARELLQKIQTLQRRLIAKTEEVRPPTSQL